MTTRQPKGIPVGGQFAAAPHAEALLELAAFETSYVASRAAEVAAKLADQRDFQRRQMVATARRHQAIACAAAAHHVLKKHPDAAVLVFEVRDERAYRLAEVFNRAGNRVTRKPTGDWATDALCEIHSESVYDLAYTDGVDLGGNELRVTIGQALDSADAVLDTPPPALEERPLTEEDQKILAAAAEDAHSYISAGVNGGDFGTLTGSEEARWKARLADLERVLGYDR